MTFYPWDAVARRGSKREGEIWQKDRLGEGEREVTQAQMGSWRFLVSLKT